MTSWDDGGLPKYPEMEGKPKIDSVGEYIRRIGEYIKLRNEGEQFYVFRGEPQVYDQPCRPILFRKGYLAENGSFEKTLFEAMRQNQLTQQTSYLNDAIVAQHGEFPSRLLDVSYNCLIALYFAVTPYYHYPEDKYDKEDGMVFLFFIDEVFSPSAENTNDAYEATINRDKPWFQAALFQKNHKFIDHATLCQRIIAQQGAFILFQGDQAEALSKSIYCGIRIPAEAKARLRRELKDLFGIHTGSVYPEIVNLVQEMTEKSKWIRTEPFGLEGELQHLQRQFEKELDYYLGYIISVSEKSKVDAGIKAKKILMIMREIEEVVEGYQERIILFAKDFEMGKDWPDGDQGKVKVQLKKFIEGYNKQLKKFNTMLQNEGLTGFSVDTLQLKLRYKEEK